MFENSGPLQVDGLPEDDGGDREVEAGGREMKDNSEPEEDRGLGTDYSAEEAEQMGAFIEDALSFEDVRESIEDVESEK